MTVAVAHQVVHRALLADVGDVDAQAIVDAVDVEQIAAVVGDQRVDQQHVGAEIDQLTRQVAADEAEAAGDHHPPAAVELAVSHGHGARVGGGHRRGGRRRARGDAAGDHDQGEPQPHARRRRS